MLHLPQETRNSPKKIRTPSDASCLLEFFVAKGYITLTKDEIKDKGLSFKAGTNLLCAYLSCCPYPHDVCSAYATKIGSPRSAFL